jgi:hypothetical protein
MSNTLFHRFVFVVVMVVLCSVWTGCHTATNDSANKKESAIDAYSSSIKSIKLPFVDTCYDTVAVQQVNPPDSLFQFIEHGQLIGKVYETNKYVAILYTLPADIQLPVLEVFNKEGKEIASLTLLMGDCCGEDEACAGVSTVCITKELHIILKDSTQTFERDKKNADKKYHVQIEKKQREYVIDSTGRIIPLT